MNPVLDMMTRPCTVRHVTRGEPDAYGDSTVTTTTTTALCELQQSRSTEVRDGETVVTSEWSLYGFRDPATGGPLEVAVDADDEVDVDGTTYAVDGKPWTVRDPLSGEASHVEARLRLVQ